MGKSYKRREFIKVAAWGGLGLYVTACDFRSTESKTPASNNSIVPADSASNNIPEDPFAKLKLYDKNSDRYEALRTGFNKRISRYPKVIALCESTKDVALAMDYAKHMQLPVAIKSGGHAFEGFSSNDGGLVIDLSSMNEVKALADDQVSVGPGCKLKDLYEAILPNGRLIPAGSCAGVGVGGLTLGGGYGIFSRALGLTCDSLLAVTMVDGNGNIHQSQDNPELLWACKGGANGNFGVVTEMTFTTHPAPKTLTSHRLKARSLTTERAVALLKAWFENMKELPDTCFSAFVLNGKTLTVLITNSVESDPTVDQILSTLGALCDETLPGKPRPLAKAIQTYYGIQEPLPFKNASAGMYKGFEDIETSITQVLNIVTTTPGMIYQVNTLGGRIADEKAAKASSFPYRDRPFLSELQTYWEREEQAARYLERFRQVQQIFAANGIAAHYRNYPDIDFENTDTAYYGPSLERLKKVKQRYDPENRIRHEQSIGG